MTEKSSNKQHLGAYFGLSEQFCDVFIGEPDAAILRSATNFARVMGAVDSGI